MNIQIKSLKHFAELSEETHCYHATVYIDGKRSFIAKNDGHGGCDDYLALEGHDRDTMWALVKKADEYCKTLPKEPASFIDSKTGKPYMHQPDLESVICDLVNDELTRRDLKKTLRKITVVTVDGCLATYPAKHKPTAKNCEQVEGHTDVLAVLNTMSPAFALQVYREVA